jgi:hypothetical protein
MFGSLGDSLTRLQDDVEHSLNTNLNLNQSSRLNPTHPMTRAPAQPAPQVVYAQQHPQTVYVQQQQPVQQVMVAQPIYPTLNQGQAHQPPQHVPGYAQPTSQAPPPAYGQQGMEHLSPADQIRFQQQQQVSKPS